MSKPLAERMRPKHLDDFINQKHLLGEGKPIRKMLNSGQPASMIFWGPPGTGKTTLAQLIAEYSKTRFFALSAINSGVKEVRDVIQQAQSTDLFSKDKRPILFLDEIHRFNKAQQDALLGAVEKGVFTLIGATTENPSFEVVPALLSRCQVYTLKSLEQNDLQQLLETSLEKDPWLKTKNIGIQETQALFRYSGGDARKLLNALELVVNALDSGGLIKINNQSVTENIQENALRYDKNGEEHYDVISAFIKSLRGSHPDAAVYWLARMVEAGEDPKFIARRMLILASEDIGNANPTALVLANSTFQAVNVLGYPEARIVLSQCAIYLANSPKSNASYLAIDAAIAEVRKSGNLPVPLHLRNAPTQLMKDLNYGKDYQYPHDYPRSFVAQQYLPDALEETKFYAPGQNSREQTDAQRLDGLRKG